MANDAAPFCGSPDTPSGIPCQTTVTDAGARCEAHQPDTVIEAGLKALSELVKAELAVFADAVDAFDRWVARRRRQRRIRERYIEFDAEELPPALPAE